MLLGLLFFIPGGLVGLLSLFSCTPLWPASWVPIVDKGRSSKSAEVQRVWEVYDERLQFMSLDALLLDESLVWMMSMAWAVWSRAAEAALADALSVQWWSSSLLRAWFLVRGGALFRSCSAWWSSGS